MSKFILTVDWEDFNQLSTKYHYGQVTVPQKEIERQTYIILDLLNKHQIKGTFFILGILARYKTNLVKEIYKQGHEVALHGTNHEHLATIDFDTIYKDIKESYDTVTNIIGDKVYGYRAPFFSMVQSRLKVLELISDLGLVYDSSVYPSSIALRGIGGFSKENVSYQLPNGNSIIELPATVYPFLNKELPMSGGSYLRLLPSFLMKKMYQSLDRSQETVMIYTHPYEFDHSFSDVAQTKPSNESYPLFKRITQNVWWNLRRSTTLPKIEYLLSQYSFTTCYEVALTIPKKTQKIFFQ